MKRTISSILALVIVLAFIVSAVPASSALESGDFTYKLDGLNSVITKYNGAGGAVAIPEKLGLLPVKGIDDSAFAGCEALTSITIPAGVATVGDSAFEGCTALFAALFCGDAPEIGEAVFAHTSSPFTVYYLEGKTGFYEPFSGCQTALFAPYLSAAPMTPTSGDVTVSITYPGMADGFDYKIGSGNWTSFKSPVVLSKNETVYARCVDASCTVSAEALIVVSNIGAEPAVPGSLKAVSFSYNSIELSWAAVSGASGYVLYRYSPEAKVYKRLKILTGESALDTGLAAGKKYSYKVAAYTTIEGGNLYGEPSEAVQATPVPAVPASVKALSASYNSAKIFWSKVSGATGYVVYRYYSASKAYERLKVIKTTALTDTGLATGANYYYKVTAFRTAGDKNIYGKPSGAVSAKPVPATPGKVKAASASYNSIKISWGKVSGAAGYVVYRFNTASKAYERLKVAKSTGISDTGLTAGREYSYKTVAYRKAGDKNIYGKLSQPVKAIPKPSVPGSLRSTPSGDTVLKLSWSAVPGATGYFIYRYNPAKKAYEQLKATTAPTFTNTGLVKGTTYYYKVMAYRSVNGKNIYSGLSATLSVKAGWRAAPSVVVYRGNKTKAEIALTFDDSGPNLGKILAICNKKGVKATFFLLAGELKTNPARWREAVKQGHQVCSHGVSHSYRLGKKTEAEIRSDILGWEKVCKDALGKEYFNRMKADFPYFRAPGGNNTPRLQQVLGDLGYSSAINWSREDVYFKSHNPKGLTLAQNYVLNAKNGDIFLMHGGSYGSLASVIDGVRNKGFKCKLLSEILD